MLLTSCLLTLGWLFVAEAANTDYQTVDDIAHLSRGKRLMMKTPHLWPNAIAPYAFEKSALRNKREIMRIIPHIEDQSCVRFHEWNDATRAKYNITDKAHLSFFLKSGCESTIGYFHNRVDRISCCGGGPCVHEISHALGFGHSQNSPNRTGWIDVNSKIVPKAQHSWYVVTKSHYYNTSRPYDISSTMHYHSIKGTNGMPVYAMDFPELKPATKNFYHFKEMSEGYQCQDKPQCHSRILGCANDGYQTVQHGKCRCVCPPGLDPDNMCKTVLKKVTTASWPKGQYALPQPKTGCPSSKSFKDGQFTEYGQDGAHASDQYNQDMMGVVKGKEINLHFCTRTAKDEDFVGDEDGAKFNWPLGMYCVYLVGDTCPTGFEAGPITYSVKTHTNKGTVPVVSKGSITFCCQYRGFTYEAAAFPTDKPFALIGYEHQHCQEVTGMHWTRVFYTLTSHDKIGHNQTFIRKWLSPYHKTITVPMCHYKPVDMNCGSVITLSKQFPTQVIRASANGLTDMECTWLIKGDSEKGTLVLDFGKFKMKKSGTSCVDKVTVNHAMIGQDGLEYCDKIEHSIRSITDKMLIRFSTHEPSDSAFEATVRWIPDEDMCYDVKDKGVSYGGDVNYTRTFQPCIPWAEMTGCPHNPFENEQSDLVHMLEGNACRNPDNTFRPWCFTNKASCARNYCDVCGLEKPYDHLDYCAGLKQHGFCSRDAAQALTYCPETCMPEIRGNRTTTKYTTISCGPPPPTPKYGVLLDSSKPLKSKYKLGESVQYKCQVAAHGVVTVRCLTTGQWSKYESACHECPEDHVLSKDMCFGVFKGDIRLDGDEAREACKKAHMMLAYPRDVKEAQLMVDLAKSGNQYIGVNDKETEWKWVYDNGTAVGYTNWDTANGEPNNRNDQDCVVLQTNLKWIDLKCIRHKYRFTCATLKWENPGCGDNLGKDMCQALLRDRPTLCTDVSDYVRGNCRQSCDIPKPGCPTSQVKCPVQEKMLPHVVSISTNDSFVSVGKAVKYGCEMFKYQVGGDEMRACLSDGSWSGQPLKCGDCPLGFEAVNSECHGLLRPAKTYTFQEAKAACREVGGFVALPKTRAENEVVSSLGATILGGPIWIGLTDQEKENKFVWQDGSGVFWTDWTQGHALRNGDDYDCTAMGTNKTWLNVDCDRKLRTVCTISKLDDDMCIDARDGGVFYDGNVNYTRAFEPCLPWAQMTHCPHHSFQKGDELENLVGNACRNPDNSYRPWCYTDKDGCHRNFCDVCGNERPKDTRDDCILIQRTGKCQDHLQECPKSCLENLPVRKPMKPYNEIHCGPPTPPSDGSIVGQVKTRYNAGETVAYKCKRGTWSVDARCMASGQWSQTEYACPECPLGFDVYEDRCYHVATTGRDNYTNAQEVCKNDQGATVALPRSQEEAKFIVGLLIPAGKKGTLWIGLSKKKNGEWTSDYDGSKPDWTNWKTNTRNPHSNRGCTEMYSNTEWVDRVCHGSFSFVCETPTLEKKTCQDFLGGGQCLQLMTEKPTMCVDQSDFSRLHCPRTCGVCHVPRGGGGGKS